MHKYAVLLGMLALANSSPVPQSGQQDPPPASVSNNFGAGAAAGVGGLGASAGLGSFQANPRSQPYLPFGAFAGLGQGDDKIGAGCSGLNCGVQLGDFVLNTRQLFEAFMNGRGGGNGNENDGRSPPSSTASLSPSSAVPLIIATRPLSSSKPIRTTDPRKSNQIDGDSETSETLLTGVSIFDRIGTAQNFLGDIIRAVVNMLTSLFSGSSSVSRNTSTLLSSSTPSSSLGRGLFDSRNGIAPSVSASTNKNQTTYYRITLGPGPTTKTTKTTTQKPPPS